jgi:hypothetical protein
MAQGEQSSVNTRLADDLLAVARSLLRSGTPEQQRRMAHPLDGPVLRNWTYLPNARPGLLLGDMDKSQRLLVHRLLSLVLSESCHAQLVTIMALEDVLDRREGHRRGRHSTDYWFLIFGTPDVDETWSFRLEGHHLCVHVTVSGDRVAVGPLFLGLNPAVLRQGERIITAPLLHEELLAREILAGLPPDQLAGVRAAPDAPPDIYTGDSGVLPAEFSPASGVPVAQLSRDAQRSARELVEFYAGRLSGVLGADLLDRLVAEDLRFAWEGGTAPGEAHYYRLTGTHFVIEHDNAADNANHIHNVLRDRRTDFGADILAEHRRTEAPG